MKIKIKNKTAVPFEDLAPGDCFSLKNGTLYIKTVPYTPKEESDAVFNAVDLTTGALGCVTKRKAVEPIKNAVIVIEDTLDPILCNTDDVFKRTNFEEVQDERPKKK